MRDYSRVSSAFWTGETGRFLRKNKDAQIVALYLITCPHANMIGVFRCPIIYISHETGLSIEGASKGLQCLLDVAFCTYEKDSELVFVHAMAKYQVGDEIKPKDKRQDSVQKQFNSLPEGIVKQGFFDRYGDAYNLIYIKPLASPLQAPPKPEAGAGAGTEAGTVKSSAIHSERDLAQLEEKNRAALPIHAEAEFACALRSLGVNVQSHHPTLLAWIADGFTIQKLTEAAAIARLKKPLPELIPANFLDRIVREPPRQKIPPAQYQTAAGRRAAEFDRAAAEFLGSEKPTGTDLKVIEGSAL